MNSTIDLCQVPAAPAPDGHTNFEKAESLAPALMAITAVGVTWGILFTTIRFYINLRKLGIADYFNLIALLLSITILGLEASQLDLARHIWDVPACLFNATYARDIIYIPALLLQVGAFFAKASIFLPIRRLFMIQKPMRIAIWTGLTFNFLLYGTGVAVATYYETLRIGDIVLDLYIFILPLPSVVGLELPIRQRIQVIAVFSLAILGIAASIVSLVERIEIERAYDQTWISTILSLCSAVELNVAIIVSSAPAFSSFTRLHFVNLSLVKLLLSSFSSSTQKQPCDTEAALETPGDGVISSGGKVISHCYYELDDTWPNGREMTRK
ncbi:hypothetical protein GGR53DRAFT_525683 [Hypoxylon sp. FL1150]|nr:hypothetical protein GGR53DRAFT_525683 [Hypoxylon sp. FL1150]